jgi:hypothetical protein
MPAVGGARCWPHWVGGPLQPRRNCVFRTIVTGRFGIVTAEFGIVTGYFGSVTDDVFADA